MWVKIIYLFVIRGCYLVLTMGAGGVYAFMNGKLRLVGARRLSQCYLGVKNDEMLTGVDHVSQRTCLGQERYFGGYE